MRLPNSSVIHAARPLAVTMTALVLVVAACSPLRAQIFERAVGGISVDPDGLLLNASVDDLGKLHRLRLQALQDVAEGLLPATELRKVSLRGLEAAIQKSLDAGEPLPDEIKYLAGLQQIRYVFVYPQQRDIVLVGPGEGWKVDQRGNIVGVGTGRPVMLLEDLLVALRTARQAAQGGISCSIDPTPEGVARFERFMSQFESMGDRQAITAGGEEALGLQDITLVGVPPTSHFARVLVAADYHMKRIGMGLEKAPIRGLPSYLQMATPGRRGNSAMPRWWLEPDYKPLSRSPDRLAWELPPGSVKAMTEEAFLAANGNLKHTGKAGRAAQRWADLMTEKYDQLAVAEPIFGQLHNCMQLAIVSALIAKERLTDAAGYSMPLLMDPADVKVQQYPAPKHLDSKVSLIKKGRNWIISASGGVLLNSWSIADKVQQGDAPAEVRTRAAAEENTHWWWN